MNTRIVDSMWQGLTQKSAVALGFFDGFHEGHRAVLMETLSIAKQARVLPTLLTFDHHPMEILSPQKKPEFLMSRSDKEGYLKQLGFEELIFIHLTSDFLNLSAEEFFLWLINKLQPVAFVSGPNYTFGKKKAGNTDLLSRLGAEKGIRVDIKPAIEIDGEMVSSTRIREMLGQGEVERASDLLGRYYHLSGQVINGDGRGKLLGYPTANLGAIGDLLLPQNGVYAVKTKVGTQWLDGVASIGTNPTFPGSRERRLEVHILDFESNLYGEEIRVAFTHYLRKEVVFDGKEALIRQLDQDVADARKVLQGHVMLNKLPNWEK